jgi:hypothetical protein
LGDMFRRSNLAYDRARSMPAYFFCILNKTAEVDSAVSG